MTKIEIHLVANSDYTEDALNEASVVLRNVTPTVSMNLADGTIGAAYGTPISITPRKTGKVDYEAIIPPQPKPLDFIEVSLHGTVIKVDAQVTTFDGNTRYPYDLTLTNKDVRKNPLWYVAEYNVNYDGSSSYSWATTPDEGYYFNYTDAKTAAKMFDGWHLPTYGDWLSILPGNETNIFSFDDGTGSYKENYQLTKFDYSDITKSGIVESSFWKQISSNEMHALRFLGTYYCSAWKYVINNNMLTIYSTLVGNITNTSEDASEWYAENWDKIFFGNNEAAGAVQRCFYIGGIRQGGSGNKESGVTEYNSSGRYQCSSISGDKIVTFAINASTAYVLTTTGVDYGRHTRLFRNNRAVVMPIEYVARYNLKTATTFATANNRDQSMYFSWNNYAGNNSYGRKANIQAMVQGTAISGYHLPSVLEWMSVVPPYYVTSSTGSQTEVYGPDGNNGTDGSRISSNNGTHLNMRERVCWGVSNSNGTYTYDVNEMFYNDYNSPNSPIKAYAIRFKQKINGDIKNAQYTCANRYEYKSSDSSIGGGPSFTIMMNYIGANQEIDINTISDELWWESPDYTIVLPACGCSPAENHVDRNAGWWSNANSKEYCYYWSATASNKDSQSSFNILISGNYCIGNNMGSTGYGFNIRLFKDR